MFLENLQGIFKKIEMNFVQMKWLRDFHLKFGSNLS